MKSDSFFQQGTTHSVCEDYAMHCDDVALVSDGCSNDGKSIMSDWGARIICAASMQQIKLHHAEIDFCDFLDKIGQYWKVINCFLTTVDKNSITATLGMCRQNGDFIDVFLSGDGCWGVQKTDGSWEINNIEFLAGGEKNMIAPYYPKYGWSINEAANYLKLFGGDYRKTTWRGDLKTPLKMEQEVFDGKFDISKPYFFEQYKKENCVVVFVGTDGVSSFIEIIKTETSKHTQGITVPQVLSVVFDGVNYKQKDFLNRQRNWIFKQQKTGTFPKRNWHNTDDFSMGVIYCGDKEGA